MICKYSHSESSRYTHKEVHASGESLKDYSKLQMNAAINKLVIKRPSLDDKSFRMEYLVTSTFFDFILSFVRPVTREEALIISAVARAILCPRVSNSSWREVCKWSGTDNEGLAKTPMNAAF